VRAVGGFGETEQRKLLLDERQRFYAREWREVVLLLGGVLHAQGRVKVDGLIEAVLDALNADGQPGLQRQARCAGLLGALVRDLAPFDYAPRDTRYGALMKAALAVFDREQAELIAVETRIEVAEALGQAGDPRLEEEALRWLEIPGGRFLRGAQKSDHTEPGYDPETIDREAPPHRVEVDGFRLGRWPVTVAEYALFVDDGGYKDGRWWESGGRKRWIEPSAWDEQLQYPNRPVVNVSWFEASAYCAWLTWRRQVTGLARSAEEVARLPTEAEREYAARDSDGRRYPWSTEDTGPELLNFNGNIERPTPVGVYPAGASPEGALDPAGNVWEFCADWFSEGYYRKCAEQGTVRNPRGPERAGYHVLRGGSWSDVSGDARTTARVNIDPDFRDNFIGFRVLPSWRQD
jgi:formylglycine-generating enzyme required for sulfatase activity